MDSQKIENLLNLSLSVPETALAEMSELSAGYDVQSKTWELVFKYHGNVEHYLSDRIQIETLLAGYGIVILPEALISYFASLPEIEYIEKSKTLYFA